MKGLVRFPSSGFHFKKAYLLLLMTISLVSQNLIFGTELDPDDLQDMDLRRSTARYQQYMLQRDEYSTERELLQVDDEELFREEAEIFRDEENFIIEHPYHLGTVTIKDWDEQRRAWLTGQPRMKKKAAGGKPRVLIITGSQPAPCGSAEGDHFHLKALKNKIDYARMHDYEIFYNFLFLDPKFSGVWAKLPIIRTLMLSHPEIEWFFWMDSDAIFTDMLFEIPFHEYEDYNLVIWAWMDGLENKDWVAVNDGVFLLRNCQWSLDLFDKWSPMGPSGKIRDEAGKFLSTFLKNRFKNFPADDQSALMYVMLTDKEVMDKVKLIEKEYKLHGYWVSIVEHYEKYMLKYHPGLGDCRWPFVTHFTGCSPCSGNSNPNYPLQMCMDNFYRAFNFADNQVLAYMGYQHKSLASTELVRIWNETTRPLRFVGVSPWKHREAQVQALGLPDDCYNF